jgi:hypothetical protein
MWCMRRGSRPQSGSAAPLYFVYLSQTKVNMLYPQIPQRLSRSLEAEVKANIGFLQATVRGGKAAGPEDSHARVSVVTSYLEKHDKVGTVAQPERYIKDTATLKYGVVSEYASDIAFFGGGLGSTDIGLIGSSESMVGEVQRCESGHAPFYYTLRFLNSMTDHESSTRNPPYFSYRKAFDIASAAAPLEAQAVFFAKTLHQEPGLVIATPLYVAITE